jgi:hypothetical protein
MNKIVRFEEFSKNEELFHGQSSGYGESGAKSKAFDWITRKTGKLLGMPADILEDYLISKVDDGEITEEQSEQILKDLEFTVSHNKMKKEQIYALVDEEISKMKGK